MKHPLLLLAHLFILTNLCYSQVLISPIEKTLPLSFATNIDLKKVPDSEHRKLLIEGEEV